MATQYERLLGAALGGALVFYAAQAIDRAREPDPPGPTTVTLDVPLWIDGERAGTCQLEITPTTVGSLHCHDITVPTTTTEVPS